MQQDALAKRKSEVDIFAGTLIEIAGHYGIPVPTNERYYKIIKEMESKY
jgi:2-dehydropantoate 2-reductase